MAKKEPLYPHKPKSKLNRSTGIVVLSQTQSDGNGNGHGESMNLGLSRERATDTIISNLIQAQVIVEHETDRYRKVLERYDNATLVAVLIHSNELREIEIGE